MTTIRYLEATMRDVDAIGRFNDITEPELYYHEYWSHMPGRSVLMSAWEEEKIIGVQALIAYFLNVNGKKILTGKSERTLVSPAYRGRDVWSNLMEGCIERGEERGHEFFWGASTPAVKAFKKLGFFHIQGHRRRLLSVVKLSRVTKIMRSPEHKVPINPWVAYQTLRQRDLEQGLKYMRIMASIYSSSYNTLNARILRSGSDNKFELVNLPKSYGDIYDLYQEIRGNNSNLIWLHQDEAFCDWAFHLGRNPVTRWYAYKNGKLRGYLYGLFEDSLARILDFAAADADAFNCLLGGFRRACLEGGQIFIEATVNPLCPQQQIPIQCLKSNGFFTAYTGGTTVVRIGKYKDMNILGDPRCFYMTDLWSLLYNRRHPNAEHGCPQ